MRLTEDHLKEVKKIKKKYDFKEKFDLFEKLNYLPTAISLYPSIPRSSVMKAQVKGLIKSVNKVVESLRNSSLQTKILINQTPESLIKIGYKDIRGTHTDWQLSKFESDLGTFYTACIFALHSIPVDLGGRKKDSISQYIIFRLAPIYHIGTGNEPTCGWTDSGDDQLAGKHIGNFYEFVLDLTPLLNEMGIELGKDSSIGTYCVEALMHYRSILQEKQTQS